MGVLLFDGEGSDRKTAHTPDFDRDRKEAETFWMVAAAPQAAAPPN
jgi:hypothetical protein